jgi:hypothetical protein
MRRRRSRVVGLMRRGRSGSRTATSRRASEQREEWLWALPGRPWARRRPGASQRVAAAPPCGRPSAAHGQAGCCPDCQRIGGCCSRAAERPVTTPATESARAGQLKWARNPGGSRDGPPRRRDLRGAGASQRPRIACERCLYQHSRGSRRPGASLRVAAAPAVVIRRAGASRVLPRLSRNQGIAWPRSEQLGVVD